MVIPYAKPPIASLRWRPLQPVGPLNADQGLGRARCSPRAAEGCSRRLQKVQLEEQMVAPQGFEPRLNDSESSVLPLNEGATQVSARGHEVQRVATFVSVTGGLGWVKRADDVALVE